MELKTKKVRRRVLINWYYSRFDLTEYLLKFGEEIEIVFLFKQLEEAEPDYITQNKNVSVVYWGNYRSPYKLLKAVSPDIVVFADLESFNQIALNIAARNSGITTYVLQHGIRGEFEINEALSTTDEKSSAIQLNSTSFWSMRFLMNALRPKNISQLPSLLRFIYERKKNELTVALFKCQFELRRADFYIEFSEENAGYHRKRDGVPDNRFIIVGNPLFDGFFDYLKKHSSNDSRECLLIDCPFLETVFYSDHGIGVEEKRRYLEKLTAWTKVNGYQLKIKLHPLSYDSKELFQDESIEYLRNIDLKKQIAKSQFVFFLHFSSITPVILPFKPSVYFHHSFNSHTKIFEKLGFKPVNLFGFDETKADLSEKAQTLSLNSLKTFLHSTDGKAAERIKEIFLTSHR